MPSCHFRPLLGPEAPEARSVPPPLGWHLLCHAWALLLLRDLHCLRLLWSNGPLGYSTLQDFVTFQWSLGCCWNMSLRIKRIIGADVKVDWWCLTVVSLVISLGSSGETSREPGFRLHHLSHYIFEINDIASKNIQLFLILFYLNMTCFSDGTGYFYTWMKPWQPTGMIFFFLCQPAIQFFNAILFHSWVLNE